MQAQESISARIVSHARRIYETSGGPPAHVSVCFGPGRDLRNLNRDRTADELASFVRNLNLIEWQRFYWRPEDFESPLLEDISFVHALGVPSPEMSHWAVVRAGWAAPLTAGALQARVNEKAMRLSKYRETVRENWLVVIADATKPSGLFDARSRVEAGGVSSPFSRTFFYAHPDRMVVELGA